MFIGTVEIHIIKTKSKKTISNNQTKTIVAVCCYAVGLIQLKKMDIDNLKIADITLVECLHDVAVLAGKIECFVDEIPEILKEDFNNFIVGHTLSTKENRTITYDMMAYYKKIITKGIDYPIKWAKAGA